MRIPHTIYSYVLVWHPALSSLLRILDSGNSCYMSNKIEDMKLKVPTKTVYNRIIFYYLSKMSATNYCIF